MSTAAPADQQAPPGDRHAGQSGTAPPQPAYPAERGTLTVDEKVVERVAGYAVTLVDGASAAPRRVLGVTVTDATADTEASVKARVDGHTATIDASVAIGWPASVRTVSTRLRDQVRKDVERLTGVHVDHIDIDVVSMTAPAARRRRVL